MKLERALAVVKAMQQPRLRLPEAYKRPPYNPVQPAWRWETATPRERAESIRHTATLSNLTSEALCDLYSLTWPGLVDILRGQDWQQVHQR